MNVKIAPSVLAADFGRLGEEVEAAEEAGADWIHVDVMDGHFVPNITLGPAIARAVRRATTLPVDVHLMIEKPARYVEAFADAGADWISVHQEADPHLHRTVERIRELGARPGVVVNPATPVETLTDIAADVDLILIMSVNPGFGGQRFIPASLDRIRRARRLLDARGRDGAEVEVDGGIAPDTAGAVAGAGASVLVAGSAVFRSPEGVAEAISALRDAAGPR
ncbi:MAG: ribulose-phosphate 3-epimerase [Gemmatimonadota bacterium]|jgi:ribulose-phosphate 3-epimerase